MSAFSTPTSRPRQWSSPSLGPKAALSATSTPLLDSLQGNDDEQERRQRRRSKVTDLHGIADSSINDSVGHSATGTPAAVPKLSTAQISEHYSTCIKLSTENKITTKNAFGLHLIDYMADILKQKDSELNFKVAAGTLDASTKIYAVRVDAVHADAYRVLGGLGSETKPKEGQDAGEEAEVVEGSEGDQAAVKQAPKKKRPPKKTVEQNLSNINRSESEMKCEVDPMFQRMAASFDENSTAGVFLSVLFSEDNRCELRFPSHMTLLRSQSPCTAVPTQHAPVQSFTENLKALEERPICPSLEDFSFTRWTPDQTINQMLEKMKQGEHAFDVNADVEPDAEEEVQDFGDQFDADGDDGGLEDYGGQGDAKEHKDACGLSSPSKGRGVIPIGEGDIATMCLQLSSQPREYSYFSPRTMATWVGPGYWLFKPGHKQDHMPEKEPRKRAPKAPFAIDFNEDIHFHNYFRTTRAATTISKSALNSNNKKTTLPADFQYPLSALSQLNMKPSNTLSAEGKKRLSGEMGDGIGEYDYNNANDTANFCPGVEGADSDDDCDAFAGSDDSQPAIDGANPGSPNLANVSTYGEDCLVPEPYKVNTIEINYAKTAKKMDMKRLKSTMWDLLTDSPEKPTQESANEQTAEVSGEKSFSQSTRTLLQRLPASMANNLSVPLAFVALLHLANEKNLELHKVDDMTDIIIKQGL
ncbi:condensin complex subunit 2 [Chanos chanos]|uniref:Condensin complex subunit 2 n=1 Tax=Chanos chanos TaxID=29144 RepID=A0A6J2WTT6_CHACN|nr:condensin complex subunit 2 [Chanos chanos]